MGSNFVSICDKPRVAIESMASTVPAYRFLANVGGSVLGADLDGDGKVDLLSYPNSATLSNFEAFKNAGELKNGLWEQRGSIKRQDLIALRDECEDGAAHTVSKTIEIGALTVALGGISILFAGMALGLSAPVIAGAGVAAGLAEVILFVSAGKNSHATANATKGFDDLFQHI